jgi:hypothetical protein
MAAGVAASNSDCFAMMGADDRLAPDYLEATLAVMSADAGIGFVYTSITLFGTVDRRIPAKPFRLASMLAANIAHGTALTRRAAYDDTPGYDGLDLAKFEDWDLFLGMLDHGWRAGWTNDTTLYYRQHGPSRNSTSGKEQDRVIRRIMEDHPTLYWPSPGAWYWLHKNLFSRLPRVYVGLLMASLALHRRPRR